MLETRWYDCGNAYRVLVMDPTTSGVTWEDVTALIVAGETLPDTVFRRRWVKEEPPTTQAAHIESCKRETLLLAEAVLTPQTPQDVTLRS